MQRKKQAYRMAYAGLAAEHALREARRIALTPTLLQDKLQGLADRACRGTEGKRWHPRGECITDAIGMSGRTHLATLESVATRVFAVHEQYGAGALVLDAIATTAERAGREVVCSLDPLDPNRLVAVLLVETGDLYTLHGTSNVGKQVYTEHFLEKGAMQALRPHLRALARAERAVRESTDACFAQIRRQHFALEEIYTAAMDLTRASAFLEELVCDIFS
jgi:hypothetical protein